MTLREYTQSFFVVLKLLSQSCRIYNLNVKYFRSNLKIIIIIILKSIRKGAKSQTSLISLPIQASREALHPMLKTRRPQALCDFLKGLVVMR